ncbi:ABC transporter substrate-binding protein [Candidatus Albibeggiatoa sp. nov. BB20]|uniref:ABC transporter substrate-binding protein n=1 Tax=Candidatus Albibeggiatoa sp. nov. BB20 TaxID=3162723 RepID=UPI003365AF0C
MLLIIDAGRLYRAKQAGVLQTIESEVLNTIIPTHYRDETGEWYGLLLRAWVVTYAKDRVKLEQLSTSEDLQNEQWCKRVCIRSSSNLALIIQIHKYIEEYNTNHGQ